MLPRFAANPVLVTLVAAVAVGAWGGVGVGVSVGVGIGVGVGQIGHAGCQLLATAYEQIELVIGSTTLRSSCLARPPGWSSVYACISYGTPQAM